MRGRQPHVEDALLRCDERVEFLGHVSELGGAALLGEQLDEVHDGLVRAGGDLREYVLLHPRVDLGILEHEPQLVDRRRSFGELAELLLNGLERAALLRRLEQGARVDAVRDGYDRLPSRAEKSISARASSISRCWSAPVSDLRVIFSAASSESFPTSSRISPSACAVACS